jgi:hypothetical protein
VHEPVGGARIREPGKGRQGKLDRSCVAHWLPRKCATQQWRMGPWLSRLAGSQRHHCPDELPRLRRASGYSSRPRRRAQSNTRGRPARRLSCADRGPVQDQRDPARSASPAFEAGKGGRRSPHWLRVAD